MGLSHLDPQSLLKPRVPSPGSLQALRLGGPPKSQQTYIQFWAALSRLEDVLQYRATLPQLWYGSPSSWPARLSRKGLQPRHLLGELRSWWALHNHPVAEGLGVFCWLQSSLQSNLAGAAGHGIQPAVGSSPHVMPAALQRPERSCSPQKLCSCRQVTVDGRRGAHDAQPAYRSAPKIPMGVAEARC